MPLRSRPGASQALEKALRAEGSRVRRLSDPADQVIGISDVLATLETEYERLNAIRLAALRQLAGDGLSYEAIAKRTGLSKTRVGQLVRQAKAPR